MKTKHFFIKIFTAVLFFPALLIILFISYAGATPFIMTGGAGATYRGFWKSPNYRLRFNGMALGDVDHDGLIETVVISEGTTVITKTKCAIIAYELKTQKP